MSRRKGAGYSQAGGRDPGPGALPLQGLHLGLLPPCLLALWFLLLPLHLVLVHFLSGPKGAVYKVTSGDPYWTLLSLWPATPTPPLLSQP